MAPREGAEYLPVKKPGLRTARVFRRVARMAGVDLPEPVAGTAPGNARPLVRITGLPLTNVVRRALEYSNNLVSELIGQVAARKLTGKAMTLEASSWVLRGWLKDRLPGIPWHGFHLVNHSGLTSKARLTPAQMAAIIRFAAGHRYGGKSYVSLLPVSGMRESMRGRFRDPATALRLWAKTGTLKYAKGLTGVLFVKSGNQIAFALYVTDYFKRRRYDADPNPQAPATQALADEWIGRAEALEESLVREWLLEF
jgi:D-alanyl-D-alanine carboxypeptidase/D-alanyl-D-alanine-endopeptidase (penicillin-binding protein 4)